MWLALIRIFVLRAYFETLPAFSPVCGDQFQSRLRCMRHVHYSRLACLSALMDVFYLPLPVDAVLALDACRPVVFLCKALQPSPS